MNARPLLGALAASLLLLVPNATAITFVAAEPFTDPAYTTTSNVGLGPGPCEIFEDRVSTLSWVPLPYTPAGPPAGPVHPMHTTGTAPGATGWHQGYMMHVRKVIRTDSPALPGVCGLAPIPWISSITTDFQVYGGGTLAAPTDFIDVTLQGTANTLVAFAAASGATITGSCFASFGGPPPPPFLWNPATNTCAFPTATLTGGGTHNYHFTATASNPTVQIPFLNYKTFQNTFYFESVPTPGTGTPGGVVVDEIDLVFDVFLV